MKKLILYSVFCHFYVSNFLSLIFKVISFTQYFNQEVKASCLKTLTAIIHLDRNPRLQSIIDSTGATSYHGFLPSLVRQCIQHMTSMKY